MTLPFRAGIRVLAIDPITKGLGFAVLEEHRGLIDWGVRNAATVAESRRLFSELLDHYAADVLVLGDHLAWDARRPARVRRLMEALERIAAMQGLGVRRIPRRLQERAFAQVGARTKQAVAIALVRRYPELADALPPERRLWMCEDYKMAFFDAVALGTAFFYAERTEGAAA